MPSLWVSGQLPLVLVVDQDQDRRHENGCCHQDSDSNGNDSHARHLAEILPHARAYLVTCTSRSALRHLAAVEAAVVGRLAPAASFLMHLSRGSRIAGESRRSVT